MRILLLNYEFPPLGGGAATASAQIARHMAARGATVAVLTSHFKGLPRREERDGYTIYRVPVMRRRVEQCSLPEMGAFILGAAIPALRLATRFKPDLMHVFFGMPTGPVGLLVHKLKGVPYLLSLRGGDVPGFMGEELARTHRLAMPITKQVWSHAGIIVANSEGLRELARRTMPDRHIEIVPNGVDLDLFSPGAKSADGKVRLLFVGRLASQKGLPYLLTALASLESELRKQVVLELVGSGPEDGRLRAMLLELGLTEVVEFSGWVGRAEIVERYRSADLFVLPSLDEGMPNVVLEAMACGLPVLATDIRGNRELVRDGANGLLVPPTDSVALAAALRGLISDHELRTLMGHKSRELVAHYSWSSTAERYLELSRQLVSARTAARVEKAEPHSSDIVARLNGG